MRRTARVKASKDERNAERLIQPVAGIEAEFVLLVDGRPARPEDVFGDPRGFVTVPLMHRVGRSFHLPNGSAIYFDTGVIEIATPVMELEQGCFGRLTRLMQRSIAFVRSQLDDWERRSGRRARLQGFSTHYNVSIADDERGRVLSSRVGELAWLLAHVVPAPVMLLGTNRRSTGVGVRPRPGRVEITADYPPDPSRLAATGSVIGGIVTAVAAWSDLRVESLRRRGIPVVEDFVPMRHTSRRGWLAHADCYPQNPFACRANARVWSTTLGRFSLRQMAHRVFSVFRADILRLADPFSYHVARRILTGVTTSWLDDPDRPDSYDDVGRTAGTPAALQELGLARYETVVRNAVQGKAIELDDERWTPVAVRGWSRVVFRRDRDGAMRALPLDELLKHKTKN